MFHPSNIVYLCFDLLFRSAQCSGLTVYILNFCYGTIVLNIIFSNLVGVIWSEIKVYCAKYHVWYLLLLYIELTISFLIGWKRTVIFQNQRPWRHNCRLYIIMLRTLKFTGNHVMYDHSAWFLRVIMSSSFALFCLLSMKKQKHDLLFRSMYNKTIIRFGFCDMWFMARDRQMWREHVAALHAT